MAIPSLFLNVVDDCKFCMYVCILYTVLVLSFSQETQAIIKVTKPSCPLQNIIVSDRIAVVCEDVEIVCFL